MIGANMPTGGTCYCDCHKAWGSTVPPKCYCTCRFGLGNATSIRTFQLQHCDSSIKDRLEKLELKDIDHQIKRISDLERIINGHSENNKAIATLHKDMVERILKLEEKLHDLISYPNVVWAKYSKTPHKCPICAGNGFYHRDSDKYLDENLRTKIQCHGCDSKGLVWG